MSETYNSIEFEVDTPTWLASHTTATYEDLVKECILPRFKSEVSNLCRYVDIAYSENLTYPAIALPWHDGVVDDTLTIYIPTNKTTVVGSTQTYPHLGVATNELKSYMVAQSRNSTTYGGGLETTYRMDTYNFAVRMISCNDFLAIGIKHSVNLASVEINAPYILTSFEKNNETIRGGIVTDYVSNPTLSRVTIYLSNGDTSYFYPQQTGGDKSGVAIASPIDLGNLKSDYFYIVPSLYTSCNGEWNNSNQRYLLQRAEYNNDLWYKNAFTINGQSFDVWIITNNNTSTNNRYAMICRKHRD